MTWLGSNKHMSDVWTGLDMFTLDMLSWFKHVYDGFKHVYDMVMSKQTRVKCCPLIRHVFQVCTLLSAQCNHCQVSFFCQLDIGFKHVYDMVGTRQTRVKWCQLIIHVNLVCAALTDQCNHLRPSASTKADADGRCNHYGSITTLTLTVSSG